MGELTVIVGLPGSGKTHLLRAMAASGEVHLALPDQIEGRLDGAARDLALGLSRGIRIGIDGQSWRHAARRVRLVDVIKPAEVRWVWFEFNPAACLRNIIYDGLFADPSSSDGYHRMACVLDALDRYAVPPGVPARPVYRRELRSDQVEAFFDRFPRCGPFRSDVEVILGIGSGAKEETDGMLRAIQ